MIDEETGEIVFSPRVPVFRTEFNYDRDAVSRETGLACTDATRAQQQYAEECDINTIVERFGLTGELPNGLRVPQMVEFTDVVDYQTALSKLAEADEAFMQMPAAVRSRFQNDAGSFVDFVSNPANIEQCREWGLANAKPVENPAPPVAQSST